jgi:hypothetical protein
MELIYWVILGLGVLLLLCLYIIRNLFRKQEFMEEMLVRYSDYINKISIVVELSNEKFKVIDEKGIFKSDDEIGFFFNQIKIIQDLLNQFIVKK